MARDYLQRQNSLIRGTSFISQNDEPYMPPLLQKFTTYFDEIGNEYEQRPIPFSRQTSNFFLYDPLTPLGPRRSITQQNNPLPLLSLQSQKSQIIDTKQKQEQRPKNLEQMSQEESDREEDRVKQKIKKQQQQKDIKSREIQKKIKKRNSELEQQPCFCRNSGCLKRYCRCFHSGRMCLKDCQCVEGCLNNNDHQEERNNAIKHVNEKCHRNKNVPKDALFKLKDCFGCNCKKTRCQTGYCECFLRKSKCTMDCQCENCENGLDEAYLESQQKRKNYRAKKK
ncbi:unnamed protein product [Paramecium primaurelia]|uniref:CRC domain-containing protein n=1 Tax=Paramecium primaurelia TaxID=5886 RepID=A0A8S1M9Y0_PARPR|nr:unnamed protein product [Paramecium primaurelia]